MTLSVLITTLQKLYIFVIMVVAKFNKTHYKHQLIITNKLIYPLNLMLIILSILPPLLYLTKAKSGDYYQHLYIHLNRYG